MTFSFPAIIIIANINVCQVMFKPLVWYLYTHLALHLVAARRECLYEFTSHPTFDFNCNPYESLLQLHCSVTGPLDPHFQIQWYLADSSSEIRLVNSETHQISNNVLNVVGDVNEQIRSISSLLVFSPVPEVHANRCIRCQVEFDNTDISLSKDDYRLCLDSGDTYSSLPSCGDNLVVFNTSSFCATAGDLTFGKTTVTTSAIDIITTSFIPPPTEFISPTAVTVKPPLVQSSSPSPLQPTSLPMPSSMPLTAMPSSMPLTGDANIASFATTHTPENTDPNGEEGSAVEAGLFAAIAICIVFIVAIIILMYFVIRLFRQWRWRKREKERNSDEDGSASGNAVAPTSATTQNSGYIMERFHIDSESLFLSTLEEDIDGIMTTRSLQDLSHHQPVPPIPPKPWKKAMTKSSSASALNFRSLSHGYNNFTFPNFEGEHDNGQSSVPPPIPVRSRSRDHSREHFYHTLECSNNDDSGLVLSSPVYSQHSHTSGSQQSTPVMQESSTEESHQIKELFDDPRYVALLVDGEEEGDLREGNLMGRREKWRSTPALASTGLTGRGGPGRRSLRVTQVVGTQIYN